MAAEVSADLHHIQDEDVLRRMWSETEDFGQKKEIRARMYKLREQRLKEFYTTGEVVKEITGGKHSATTHTESIGDQGFLTMKAKEIRDSESPTREISRRGNGYWNTVEERGYSTGNREDGALVQLKEESRKGEGVIVDGNTETRIATAKKSSHEKAEKSDENMSMKSETISQNKAIASDAVTVLDDGVSRTQSDEKHSSSKSSKEEKSSHSTTQTSSYSTSSSSRKVTSSSSSKSQTYLITSDGQRKLISDSEVKAITGGDNTQDFQSSLRDNTQDFQSSLRDNKTTVSDSKVQDFRSTVKSDVQSTASDSCIRQRNVQDTSNNQTQIVKSSDGDQIDDYNVDHRRSTHDSNISSTNKQHQSTRHSSNTSKSTTTTSYVISSNQNETKNVENQRQISDFAPSPDQDSLSSNRKISNEQNVQNQTTRVTEYRDISDRDSKKVNDSNEFISNEKIDITKTVDDKVSQRAPSRRDSVRSTDTHHERSTETIQKSSQDVNRTSTNEKILTEIQKLDTYLQGQGTPIQSEPAAPKSVTDGAKWTVVSDKGGEFVYQDDKAPMEGRRVEPYEYQPREAPIKPPSSLDLPKDSTDGQYVTTYQQSYNRISVDSSPSHQYFMSTLRASPLSHDRLTPTSPTKSSRSSLDRSSPERRVRPSSRGSLDRSSPDTTSKKRTYSKGSLDRTSPDRPRSYSPTKSLTKERTYSKGSLDRTSPDRPRSFSPTKSLTKERRGSSGSYTIEKRKDSRRKTTEINQSTLKDNNKPKRKFSSTQQKAATKARSSTPGASPSPSPTRGSRPKDTSSGSESDISHATFNKTTSISSFHDENVQKKESVTTTKTEDVKTVRKDHPIFDITRGKEREKSPEYSSEGSVSREVRRSKITSQINATETSAFRPIKPTKDVTTIDDSNQQFISEEKNYTVKETDDNESSIKTNKKDDQTCTITDITDEFNDSTKPVDNEKRPVGSMERTVTTTVTTTTNITETNTSRDKKHSTPSSSPDKPSDKATRKQPSGSPDKFSPTKKPSSGSPERSSPTRKQPSGSPERHSPARKLPSGSPDRFSPTRKQPSGSPERYSPTRSPTRKVPSEETSFHRRQPSGSPTKKTPSSSPASSPERRTIKTTVSEKRTSRRDDRSSISSSPSPTRRRPLIDTQNIQKSSVTSKQFITEERRVSKKSTERPTTSPTRREPVRKGPAGTNTPIDKFASPQRKPVSVSSPQKSPTVKSSSPQKTKLPGPKQDIYPTKGGRPSSSVTTTSTTTRRTITTTSDVSKQSPRGSSIPRTTKPLTPRNSKDKIENTTVKKTTTDIKRTSSVPRHQVTSVTKTVSRLPSSSIERKTPSSLPSQSKPGTPRRPMERTTPTSPRSKFVSNTERKTTQQTIKKISPVKDTQRPSPKPSPGHITETIEIKETTRVVPKSNEIRINKQFITEEKTDFYNLEDENPPDEFYASFSDVTDSSPERKPKTSPSHHSAPREVHTMKAPSQNVISVSEYEQINKKTDKKSKKTTKRRKSLKDTQVSSSSSSSSDEEDIVQIDETDAVSQVKRVERDTINTSNQDLLTVIVQHPKSSRESSPGKMSAGVPFCTTSEDGESNPRYADFVSEPEDVEIFDKHQGPSAPVRLTDEPDANVPSVADRVNTFLENTRNTQEVIVKKETTPESPKSVLKKKSLFENIAKNQTVDSQQSTTEEIDQSEIIVIDERYDKLSPSSRPTGIEKTPKPKGTSENTTTKELLEKTTVTSRIDNLKESSQLIESEIRTSQNVQETIEDIQAFDETDISKSVKNIKTTAISSKPTQREPSKPESVKPEGIQKQSPKSQEQTPAKKPFERKTSGTVVDVSSKKNFFEKKVQDLTQSILKTAKKISSPKTKQSPVTERPDSRNDETTAIESQTDSYMRATVSSTVKTTSNEDHPGRKTPTDDYPRKTSKPDVFRKTSGSPKPDEPGRKNSKSDRASPERKPSRPTELTKTLSKPDEVIRRPSGSSPDGKSSKPSDTKRSPTKPEELFKGPTGKDRISPERKPSKPSEITRTPSKPDEVIRRPSGTSPERKTSRPQEILKSPSKDVARKLSKPEDTSKTPSKPYEITRKPTPTGPLEIRRLSKSEEVAKKVSKFEGVTKKSFQTELTRTDSFSKSSTKRSESPDKFSPDSSTKRPYSPEKRTDTRTQSYMRSTAASSQHAVSPEHPIEPATKQEEEQYDENTREEVDHTDFGTTRVESYMRSTESSSARESVKSPEDRRRSSHTDEFRETTTLRKTSKSDLEKVDKFDVTPRKTSSTTKVVTTTITRQNSKPKDEIDIESIFNLELLEEMLVKAVAYDERRRIRAQIRIVKKAIEDEKNAAILTSRVSTTASHQIKRQLSPEPRRPADKKLGGSTSPERKATPYPDQRPFASPDWKSGRSVEQSRLRTTEVKSKSPERSAPRKSQTTSNGYRDNKTVYETTSTVRSQTVKKSSVSGDVKEASPTDLITSSYGVGPTDENGRPIFGLKALRRTSTTKTLLDEKEEYENLVEEEKEDSTVLFGLRALQSTDTMPAESSQLRELVERHQQYVKESSAKDAQPRQKPKAKLRDSFILTGEDDEVPVIQSPDEPSKALSLKSIMTKTDQSGSTVRSSMESRSTVVKSHSSITSDGKVSLHRDVIHGEVSSKNGEEPKGKVTRASYSYQKDREGSTPSIKSSTATSLIGGGRRISGPKIEEITDSSTVNTDSDRRFSKEYTVEEGETRRRSSVEENVKKYTSILKSSASKQEEAVRRGSGPRITELPDDDEELTFYRKVTKTTDVPDSKTGLSSSSVRRTEESKTDSSKKVVSRGDSVKALQHKFQQATLSSSLKQSSVERTDSKGKIQQETKESSREESRVSPTGRATVTSHERVVQTSRTSRSEEQPSSFLDNTTKVTGVQDILTRMRNADLVSEASDTTEDAEARALLNKFLGASVILQGMEQGMRSAQQKEGFRRDSGSDESITSPPSAALVNQAEKLRMKTSSVRTVEEDIDNINDEKQLKILLDACSDYEGRRKLRARLRTIMSEQKGGTDDGEESHECQESSSSEVVQKGDTLVKREVHTRTTSSSAKLTKANSVQSPFAKFRQLERQNSAPRTYK